MSWNADRYEIVKHENAREIFSQVFRFLSAIIVLVGVGLALFVDYLLHAMTDPEFYPAGGVVPLFVAASIANIYTMYCNFGIMLKERTRYVAEASWIKAVVASIGYILLIPNLGVYGAALTLLVINLIEFYWINKNATREYDMGLQWKSVSMLLAAGVVCVVAGKLMPFGEQIWFSARVVLYASFAFLVYKMPLWLDGDRVIMKAGFNKITGLVVKR